MLNELTVVVLRRDLPDLSLQAGDVGTVVGVYGGGGYEVEFLTADGATVAVVTLAESDIRPMADREIFHARKLAPHSASA